MSRETVRTRPLRSRANLRLALAALPPLCNSAVAALFLRGPHCASAVAQRRAAPVRELRIPRLAEAGEQPGVEGPFARAAK